MSFIIHPALLITKDPTPNTARVDSDGRDCGAAARAILQEHGRKSNHVPIGLSARISFRYGCRRLLFGILVDLRVCKARTISDLQVGQSFHLEDLDAGKYRTLKGLLLHATKHREKIDIFYHLSAASKVTINDM